MLGVPLCGRQEHVSENSSGMWGPSVRLGRVWEGQQGAGAPGRPFWVLVLPIPVWRVCTLRPGACPDTRCPQYALSTCWAAASALADSGAALARRGVSVLRFSLQSSLVAKVCTQVRASACHPGGATDHGEGLDLPLCRTSSHPLPRTPAPQTHTPRRPLPP